MLIDKFREWLRPNRAYIMYFSAVVLFLVFIGEYALEQNIIFSLKAFLLPSTAINILFVATCYVVLMVFSGYRWSTISTIVIGVLLAFANFVKIKFFDEPFYPWDAYLLKSAVMISNEYINTIVAVLLVCLALVSLFALVKYRKFLSTTLKFRPKWSVFPLALLLIFVNMVIFHNPKVLAAVGMERSWYIGKSEAIANGLFVQSYFYLIDLDKYLPKEPAGYTPKSMAAIAAELTPNDYQSVSTSGNKPNVVMIMSESFWDPSQLPNVSFDKTIATNLKQFQTGSLISPVFGGGTANVEFEVLTGLSSYFFPYGVYPYDVYLKRNTSSIVSAFAASGYETIAIHPNDGDFYNRNNVYSYLGFQEFIDIEGFDREQDRKGPYVSDASLVKKLLEVLNRDGKPKFIFVISMQNHDPYYDIYKNLEVHATSSNLDETEIAILSNYAQGIYDADKALGSVINSLQRTEIPTLLYFFGDHLPRLGYPLGIFDIYQSLGYFDATEDVVKNRNLYKVPLVTWSNYAKMTKPAAEFSPAQLAFQVLSDAKVAHPSYFNILEQLRFRYPVLQNRLAEVEDANNFLFKNYQLIQYDLLFGKQYLTEPH